MIKNIVPDAKVSFSIIYFFCKKNLDALQKNLSLLPFEDIELSYKSITN